MEGGSVSSNTIMKNIDIFDFLWKGETARVGIVSDSWTKAYAPWRWDASGSSSYERRPSRRAVRPRVSSANSFVRRDHSVTMRWPHSFPALINEYSRFSFPTEQGIGNHHPSPSVVRSFRQPSRYWSGARKRAAQSSQPDVPTRLASIGFNRSICRGSRGAAWIASSSE
jgi:hypothetical protein